MNRSRRRYRRSVRMVYGEGSQGSGKKQIKDDGQNFQNGGLEEPWGVIEQDRNKLQSKRTEDDLGQEPDDGEAKKRQEGGKWAMSTVWCSGQRRTLSLV